MADRSNPIKAGTGYIDVVPRLNKAAVTRMKTALLREMELAGKQASSVLASSMSAQNRQMTAASRAARRRVEEGARDSQRTLRGIERRITQDMGQEYATRFRQHQRAEVQRRRLLEGTTAATRTAIRQTEREQVQAAQRETRRERDAERLRNRIRSERERADRQAFTNQQRRGAAMARDRINWLRMQERAYAENEQRNQRAIRETRQVERRAQAQRVQELRFSRQQQTAAIRDRIAETAAMRQSLQRQVRTHREAMRGMQRTNRTVWQAFGRGWHQSSRYLETMGTSAVETGNLITSHLLAPLTAVSGMLTTIGVKSADSFKVMELGLQGMKIQMDDINRLQQEMNQYAVNTPYSLEDMQEYSTRFARMFASHNEDIHSKSAKRRAKGSEKVSEQTRDIIMAVGDNAAASGILNPAKVSQALNALAIMGDQDRVNMRYLKQFERATGIPAEEVAKMMGFEAGGKNKTAAAAMFYAMQNPKESGGVSGVELINKVIANWQDSHHKGAAERLSSKTITGRVQQLQEKAKLGLGRLFITPGTGDKSSKYTPLGEMLMGKKTPIYKQDRRGEKTLVGYERRGGLINQFENIAKAMAPFTGDVLKSFFEVLETFTGWAKAAVDWLGDHPGIRDMILKFVKIAAVATPFLIGFGLLTKVLGKLAKTLGAALKPAKLLGIGLLKLGKAGRGAFRSTRQVASGFRSRRRGGTFSEGYENRRQGYRDTDSRRQSRRDRRRMSGGQREAVRAIERLEEQISEADNRLEELRRDLREVNRTSLRQIQDALRGGRASVEGAADAAGQAVRDIETQGINQLNRASLSNVQREFTTLHHDANQLEGRVQAVHTEVTQLGRLNLNQLQSEFRTAHQDADGLKKAIQRVTAAMRVLNKQSLAALRQEFNLTDPQVNQAKREIDNTSDSMTHLNNRSLHDLRSEFNTLTGDIKDATGAVGTAKTPGTLSGRITNVNKRSLNKITGQVNDLKEALDEAAGKGRSLDRAINNVNADISSGGVGSGSAKHKGKPKFAAGGVLPGYQPGVDNIPAMLSPGEAILRPEVAARIGAPTIDAWNAAASRGHVSKYAHGTSSVGSMSFGAIRDLVQRFDTSDITKLFGDTVAFDAHAARIGGGTGRRAVDWGARSGGGYAGRTTAMKLRGMLEYVTNTLPQWLRRVPTGVGQISGIVSGAMAPTVGKYFWDDVWKGQGNILQRGKKFVGDVLNPSSIWQMIKDGFSGVVESVKSIFGVAKDLLTDPIGTIKDTLNQFKGIFTDIIAELKNTIHGWQEMINNPSQYLRQVWDEFYAQAKEAMPNTEGLFNFANGGIVPGYSPDDDRVKSLLSPGEAVLRPEAVRKLGYKTILDLNRGAKVGKNITDEATGKSSLIIPSPDAETFNRSVTQIEASLASAGQAVKSNTNLTKSSWNANSHVVQTSVDGKITPAVSRWRNALSGPLTAAERSFEGTNHSVWKNVSGRVSSADSSARRSFRNMRSGLRDLESSFDNAQSRINKSMGRIPSAVTRHVREAIDFIQRAMINPVNEKLLGPADIKKIGSLPQYATGGVVPGYSPGNDTVMAMLSPGEAILRPEVTKALGTSTIHALNTAARKGRLPAFANGGIVGDWKGADMSFPGDFEAFAKKVISNSLKKFVGETHGFNTGSAGATFAKKGVLGILADKDEKFFGQFNVSGSGVARWAPLVKRVLKELGLSQSYLDLVLHRIAVESGGNPRAINLWDSNASAGMASRGLMQTIPGTFNAYAGRYRKLGIYNPLANIYAGLNYATHRYGSRWPKALSGNSGYWTGTLSASPGLKVVGENGPEVIDFRGGERVYNSRQTEAMLSGSGRPIVVHVHEAKHEDNAQAVLRGFQMVEALYSNL